MHLLSVDDLSKEDMNKIFEIADDVRSGKTEMSIKEGSVLALLFPDYSTRMRVALEVAMAKLGGKSTYVSTGELLKQNANAAANVARMLGAYVDFIAASISSHDTLLALAGSSPVPVINAGTDLEQPLSALATLYTLLDKKGFLKGMALGIMGNVELNTVNSLMLAATKLGVKVSLISQKAFSPNPMYLVKAREYGIVDTFSSAEEGISGADALCLEYSSGKSKEKEDTLAGLGIDIGKLSQSALLMCSLPDNATDDNINALVNSEKSIVWDQVRNMLYVAQAAILLLSERSM
ncbi:MAG: hypothetical protein QXR85_02085 [Candidatus Micrarchaeaceae archaeon]